MRVGGDQADAAKWLDDVAVLGGVIYGGIYALANFVNPKPREMTISVPPDKLYKK